MAADDSDLMSALMEMPGQHQPKLASAARDDDLQRTTQRHVCFSLLPGTSYNKKTTSGRFLAGVLAVAVRRVPTCRSMKGGEFLSWQKFICRKVRHSKALCAALSGRFSRKISSRKSSAIRFT